MLAAAKQHVRAAGGFNAHFPLKRFPATPQGSPQPQLRPRKRSATSRFRARHAIERKHVPGVTPRRNIAAGASLQRSARISRLPPSLIL